LYCACEESTIYKANVRLAGALSGVLGASVGNKWATLMREKPSQFPLSTRAMCLNAIVDCPERSGFTLPDNFARSKFRSD